MININLCISYKIEQTQLWNIQTAKDSYPPKFSFSVCKGKDLQSHPSLGGVNKILYYWPLLNSLGELNFITELQF